MGSNVSSQIAEERARVQAYFDAEHAAGAFSARGVLQSGSPEDDAYDAVFRGKRCGLCMLPLVFENLLILLAKPGDRGTRGGGGGDGVGDSSGDSVGVGDDHDAGGNGGNAGGRGALHVGHALHLHR